MAIWKGLEDWKAKFHALWSGTIQSPNLHLATVYPKLLTVLLFQVTNTLGVTVFFACQKALQVSQRLHLHLHPVWRDARLEQPRIWQRETKHWGLSYPLVMTNIAMENGPFIDGLPINSMMIFHGKLLVITRGYNRGTPNSNGLSSCSLWSDFLNICFFPNKTIWATLRCLTWKYSYSSKWIYTVTIVLHVCIYMYIYIYIYTLWLFNVAIENHHATYSQIIMFIIYFD